MATLAPGPPDPPEDRNKFKGFIPQDAQGPPKKRHKPDQHKRDVPSLQYLTLNSLTGMKPWILDTVDVPQMVIESSLRASDSGSARPSYPVQVPEMEHGATYYTAARSPLPPTDMPISQAPNTIRSISMSTYKDMSRNHLPSSRCSFQ